MSFGYMACALTISSVLILTLFSLIKRRPTLLQALNLKARRLFLRKLKFKFKIFIEFKIHFFCHFIF